MHELPLDRKRLQALAAKARHYDIAPLFLPSYVGGKHPIAPLLTELVAEARGHISALSADEAWSLVDSLPFGLSTMIDGQPGSDSGPLRDRIATYCVVAAVHHIYYSLEGVIHEDLDASEVLAVYPELRDRLDKDGLLAVDDDFVLHDGGMEYRDHILHYHQFLRRGYTARPNYDFLGRLAAYYRRTKSTNSFRIAVDHRRIMPKDHYARVIELDTWYGPPFDPAKLDDPRAVGLTVVVRNKNSLFGLANQLDRTEFLWTYRDAVKTFEIEEISSTGYRFDAYYLNRYAHSERAIGPGVTRHLDGAVKIYLADAYHDRVGARLPNEARCFRKIKLWRIDGDVDLEDWIDLICFFFKSNEMLIEYFNPEAFEEMFELRVRDPVEWKRLQSEGATDS